MDGGMGFRQRRPKQSKSSAMLGIWADDSDEEPEERARPSFGGSKKGRGANDSAPVGMFFFHQIIILYHCLLDCRLKITIAQSEYVSSACPVSPAGNREPL
jgi:hypothetical protein